VEKWAGIDYVAAMNHPQPVTMPIPGHIDPVPFRAI
jgi:23S rRNA (adenine2503-C2)-methyltransferase